MHSTNSFVPLLFGFFLILGIGYWLRITNRLQASASDTLNLIITDVTMPALIIHALYHQRMNRDMASAVIISWIALFGCMLLGILLGKAFKQPSQTQGAMGLCAGFSNTGFLGVPLLVAIYGTTPSAAATAVLIDTFTTTLFLYTFGIAWATHYGKKHSFNLKDIVRILTTPVAVSVIFVVIVNIIHLTLPAWLLNTARILGSVTAPVVLLSLGLRLDFAMLKGRALPILGVSAIKLVASPAIALFFVIALGLHGTVGQVTVLQCAMPTAMMSAVISARYGCDSELGTGAVVFTTALTAFTLPIAASILQRFGV